nr:BamA/TamA family outer membrane protein [Nitrospirota bacterium]
MLIRIRWIAGILIALPLQLSPGPAAGESREGLPELRTEQRFLASRESFDEPDAVKGEALKSLPVKGGYTVIPLPAFAYARNESYWAGALVPILRANEREEIEDIFAPQYLHNKFVGETFSLNYYGYRNETVQYRTIAAYATKIERHFELGFKDTGVSGGRYILAVEGLWFKNAFSRFFGIGNRTHEGAESTYTSREGQGKVSAGINLAQNFSVLWTERYRDVRIDDGVIPDLPQVKTRFATITGIEGAQIFGHRLTLLYDSRDNLLTPAKGTYASLYWELAHNLHTEDTDRWVRFDLDVRHLVPHAEGRGVFVARLMIDKVFSRGVPFYERPMLGGETTLRGFGLNRFIDDNLFLVNLEERMRVFQKRIFDNPIEVELAPFLDMGRVNKEFLSRLGRTQFNPGTGIRVLSRPNVVGRIDVAHGKDGTNVFVGLDYPF